MFLKNYKNFTIHTQEDVYYSEWVMKAFSVSWFLIGNITGACLVILLAYLGTK